MEYKFANLYRLYADMKEKNKPRERFTFAIKDVTFEAIILIDRQPFELLIGAKAHQFAFTLLLKTGFRTELPDNIYYRLCEILQLNYSEHHFSSFAFLREVDKAVPPKCSKRSVQPHEIAVYKRKVSDEDKIYFHGWNDHLADGRHVRAENIDKTRRFLGDEVADFCQQNNISSMWTDIIKDVKDPSDPPGYTP